MALGVTILTKSILKSGMGGRKRRTIQITGDGSYSAGGYALAASACQLNAILAVQTGLIASEGSGGTALGVTWDKTNGKLKCWKGAGAAALTEAAAGDPNGLKGIIEVEGY